MLFEGANQALRVNVVSESAFTTQGHGVHTAFTETVAALQKHTDATVLTNSGEPADVVHIHTVGPYALMKLLFARGAKVVSAHVTPDSFVGSLVGAKTWYPLAKAYLRWYYNRADQVLAVSEEVRTELAKMGVRKPVMLVPNTIDTSAYRTAKPKGEIRKHLGLSEQAFVVMSSGQVQPRKRVDSFVACAKALPDVTFVWVGGMPFKKLAADHAQMDELMKQAPANVVFTGLIEREAVVEHYQAADMFFLPSIQETFGIVIVEAAAAGLPVMLRDIPQYRVTFGEGYLKGEEDTFAKLIQRVKDDPEFAREARESSQKIADKYDSNNGAKMIMKAYEAAIAEHKKTGA
jgi:1,2-diacylglycerol-3-alpha-glucose alpha-1,2-galactosyltransferase